MFIGKINPLSFWERFKAFIKSYPGMAGILGIACFVWTLLYKMLLVNIEAPYQWLVPLGDVFYAVALCYFLLFHKLYPKLQKQENDR